ncbi:MAG TPA: tetratricopeptide repeat protein, partial [Polyangiaceae bacterium]|nr:tetratricopeptide repeat protein [Polyangiaceae bacterium]
PALEATARLLQSEEKHGEAAQVLERLLAISDGAGATAVAIALADEYDKLGDANQAVTALERGLTFDERNEELRKRLRTRYEAAESWQGLAGLLAGDADLVEAPREKLNLLRQAAQIHSRKLGDHVTAAELLDKASHIVPGDRQVLLELCDEYSASGRGKQAAEVLERIVESYGGKRSKELAEIHRRLADAYLADGEKQRAIEELDKAFRIEPGNVTVLKNLGQIALETDDLPRAQKMFRALLLQRLDDSSPITKGEAFFNLGEVHRRLGEKTKAIQMYERALQQDQSLQEAKDRLTELKA